MEPEDSLPQSQVPAIWPYPEPARSSPHPHIPIPKAPSQYYPPIYTWVSQVVYFFQVSPSKPCKNFPIPHTRYMPRPSHSSRFYHLNNIGCGIQIQPTIIIWNIAYALTSIFQAPTEHLVALRVWPCAREICFILKWHTEYSYRCLNIPPPSPSKVTLSNTASFHILIHSPYVNTFIRVLNSEFKTAQR